MAASIEIHNIGEVALDSVDEESYVLIDEVKLWDRALSPAEVLQEYNGT